MLTCSRGMGFNGEAGGAIRGHTGGELGGRGSLFFLSLARKERKEARARQRSPNLLRRDGWRGRDWSESAAHW